MPNNEKPNNEKSSNPKDAVGISKVPWSTLSAPVIGETGLAMFEGARKYGRHNWRNVGVRSSVYYDAALRHLAAWWEGEDTDAESGLSHLAKAMAGLHVLRDAQIRGMMVDDRPPGTIGFVQVQNELAKAIIARHPVAEEAITHEDAPPATYKKDDNETISILHDTACFCDECCPPLPNSGSILRSSGINEVPLPESTDDGVWKSSG